MPHIFNFRWQDKHTPVFQYGNNGQLQTHVVEFGKNLSLSLQGDIFCAGYEKNGQWYPCPHEHLHTRKCEDCQKREGLSVAQFCDGNNLDLFSAQDLEKLNTDHYLYLALFSEKIYKVGVSATSRGFLRQIEQGTHAALILARGMGGVLARQMESYLRKYGIADKIPASHKKDAIFLELADTQLRAILEQVAQKYLPHLAFDRPEVKKYFLDPPEFITFSEYYHLAKGKQKPLHNLILKPEEAVSGTLLSIKGSFLIIETDSEKVLIQAKDLRGYQVDFTEKEVGIHTELAFQGALF